MFLRPLIISNKVVLNSISMHATSSASQQRQLHHGRHHHHNSSSSVTSRPQQHLYARHIITRPDLVSSTRARERQRRVLGPLRLGLEVRGMRQEDLHHLVVPGSGSQNQRGEALLVAVF